MKVEIELTSFEHGFALSHDAGTFAFTPARGVYCRWRRIGERRWRKFSVIAGNGQTLLDLITSAIAAVGADLQRAAA